jgi:flagella basal body P-ring formation protein FlgA
LRVAFPAEIGKQQKQPRKPSLARIEKLVDKVFLYSAVPGQEIRNEELRKFWLVVNGGNHRSSSN